MRLTLSLLKVLLAMICCAGHLTVSAASDAPGSATFAGWLDTQQTATLATVQQQAHWEPFTGWKGWAYGPEPVWIRVQVPAAVQADAPANVLIVRPQYLDKVTFYDPALGVERRAGDYFPALEDALGSVLFTFEVPALNVERAVFIKLQSTSARLVHLGFMPMAQAQQYTRFVEWSTGFLLVLSLVFSIWALVQWKLTADRVMGLFALKLGIITVWGLLFFGFARLTVGHLFNDGVLSLISSMIGAAMVGSGLWFFATLLQDYKARAWMLRCMHVTALAIAGVSLMNLIGMTQTALQIVNAVAPLCLLWIFVTLWAAPTGPEKPLIPKRVFLTYLALYGFLNSLPPLTYLGFIQETPILFIGNMGLLVFDGLIMLVILSVRQRRFKVQHEAMTTQLMLQQEQARLDQQYLNEQRKLLAMLAHEMKTPLANLRIWMEAGPKGRPVMERAIVDMGRVIERCVHAGQLADQSLKPHNEWLDAAELTQSVLTTSRQHHRARLQTPSDVCPVHADAQMLSIVLSNILENAYKYSDAQTPITVELNPHGDTDGTPGWRWTFENAVGEAGFPDPDKVFDKYYRSASAKRQSGSGLGLFLVKSLVDLMHGRVRYTPLYERVRFEIWLPIDSTASGLAP